MQPTWGMLKGILKNKYHLQGEQLYNQRQKIRYIQLFDGQKTLEKETLYLVLPEQNIQKQKGTVVICLVEMDEKISRQKEGKVWLYYEKNRNAVMVINDILSDFMQMQQWLEEIHHIAYLEKNMRKLIKCCAEYLDAGVVIVNSDYEIHEFENRDWMSFGWEDMQGADGKMTAESIEDLYRDGTEFEETFGKTGLTNFRMNEKGSWAERFCYYQNFMDDEGRYLGRIVFELKKENAEPGILELLEYAANEAAYCFLSTMQGAAPSRFSKEFHELMNTVLDQRTVSDISATAILESYGWKIRDSYCILRMISNGNVQSTHTLAYYCHLIERDFPFICAIERNAGIFCIVNQVLDNENHTFQKQLPYFLRENLFLAGMSCTFYNFLNGALYAREASYALAIGQKQNSSFWLHLFSDYTLDYCMKKMTEEYPVNDLIYPGLRILETYDREHPGTDLALTLREYLRQQYNATHTAEKLHIHRTTFLYRLRRIEELTGIRLENEEIRLHLQLSYALQDRS